MSHHRRPKPPTLRAVALCIVLAMLTACSAQPPIAWDPDTSTKVAMLYSPTTTAGLAGAYDRRYYVPEVQLWSDGRIVWVAESGMDRQIREGHLSAEAMEALLRRIVDAGFFEWEDRYQTLGGNSMPPMVLQVNLAARTKEVREHGGAPEAFYELEAHLREGAGAEGEAYVPDEGYLTLRPFSGSGGEPWPAWASLTPEGVGEGIYVRGSLLAFAWQLVNWNPTGPTYASHEGKTYHLMVQVPGVSYFEPPSPRSNP